MKIYEDFPKESPEKVITSFLSSSQQISSLYSIVAYYLHNERNIEKSRLWALAKENQCVDELDSFIDFVEMLQGMDGPNKYFWTKSVLNQTRLNSGEASDIGITKLLKQIGSRYDGTITILLLSIESRMTPETEQSEEMIHLAVNNVDIPKLSRVLEQLQYERTYPSQCGAETEKCIFTHPGKFPNLTLYSGSIPIFENTISITDPMIERGRALGQFGSINVLLLHQTDAILTECLSINPYVMEDDIEWSFITDYYCNQLNKANISAFTSSVETQVRLSEENFTTRLLALIKTLTENNRVDSELTKAIRNIHYRHKYTWRPEIEANNLYFGLQQADGIHVMEEDWDNLVILDALRLDYFQDLNTMEGTLGSIRSLGSRSDEFIEANFIDRQLYDTIYVTANPYAGIIPDDTFHAVHTAFHLWDEDIGTVMPTEMLKFALKINRQYPHKRLIIHFMQPHGPHLGPTAEMYRENLDLDEIFLSLDSGPDLKKPWSVFANNGQLSLDEVRRAYFESVDIALDHAECLANKLRGKSVITADHGEMLGERITPGGKRYFGHPGNLDRPELRRVPWFELPTSERKECMSEDPIDTASRASSDIEDKLKQLGYVS